MTTITLIGGGISGLSAAIAIQQQAAAAGLEIDLRVVEKEPRLGGKIWSIQDQGYLCEWGPNGFLDNKPMTLDLCRAVGIDSSLLRSNDNARKRFIYSGAVLHQLPETGPAFLKSGLISWPGKLRLAMEPLIPAYRGDKDETLADFGRRRLGAEALDKLIAPMVSGIFAGNPETMSLQSCFPRIHQLETEYGGLIKAMVKLAKQKKAERKAGKTVASAAGPGGILTSFQEGIQELTDGIAYQLQCEIHSGTEVSCISKSADGFKLELTDGSSMESDLVISASPAFAIAEMVAQLDHGLAELLRSIPYAAMNVVCFGYQRDKISHTLDGFGYLIPKKEGCHTLGTLWDSSIFPNRAPEGHVLLRSMLGGATNPESMDLDEEQVAEQVKTDLKRIMGIDADPDFIRIFRHPQAIPQYTVGHQRKLNALKEALGHHPGLFLTGNAFQGIGLNDCVNAANGIAAEVMAELNKR
jgi:protoporphyrinogen/coproporphyrinogen III oxidase